MVKQSHGLLSIFCHPLLYTIMPRKDAYTGPISAQAQQDLVSEGIENYELPKSVVMKIAKSSVCFLGLCQVFL